ncbi:DUF240 domain-containing protein [Mycoplasmoides genitalium]
MKTQKNIFKVKALLLSLFSAAVTITIFALPIFANNGSKTDLGLLSKNSADFLGSSKRSLAGFDTPFSPDNLQYLEKETDYDQNFKNFTEKFKDEKITNNQLDIVDIYNLFSGFHKSVKNTVDLMSQLQKQVEAANAIFPVDDAFVKLPKVPTELFKLVDDNVFPKLNPKGLNISDNIAALFERYNLKSIELKNFDLAFLRKADVIIKDKVRYNFEMQMQFQTVYVGGGNTVINLDFTLKAQTANFANLQDLQNSFVKVGNDLSTQLFWIPTVNKLTDNAGNDLTHIAKTVIGESFFQTNVNLAKSVIEYDKVQPLVKQAFEERVLTPFKKEREAAKKAYEEEQRRLEEERKRQLEELRRREAEEKRKAEEAKRNQEKARREREAYEKSFNSFNSFKFYWLTKGKDVTKKADLIDALKTAIATPAYRNRTFSLLIKGFASGVERYFNANKNDKELKKLAFGEKGIQFPRADAGIDGLYMSNFLRHELTSKAKFSLNLKDIKVENTVEDTQLYWKDNGIDLKQANPYKFNLNIKIKYNGWYNVHWWNWLPAKILGIPTDWSGEMNLTFVVNGDLSEIVDKHDYPGTFFQFTDKNELLFTLAVREQIKVDNNHFMGLLKSQNLHDLQLASGATKPPVVDLASYFHFVLLTEKS